MTAGPRALPSPTPLLDALRCHQCLVSDVVIICPADPVRGLATDIAWCGPGCAAVDGWPFFQSERRPERPSNKRGLAMAKRAASSSPATPK